VRRGPPAEHAVLSELRYVSHMLFNQLKMVSYRQRSSREPSPRQQMSMILASFAEATNLFVAGLNDVLNPVVVGHDRSVANNGGGIAVVIDDVYLRGRPLCEGYEV